MQSLLFCLTLWTLISTTAWAAHTPPVWWQQDGEGGFFGETSSGQWFTQTSITTQTGIRLHKFLTTDELWYISDKGIILASSDLEALSVYLARV